MSKTIDERIIQRQNEISSDSTARSIESIKCTSCLHQLRYWN